MKKNVLIMICVLAAAGVSAQSHTYRDISYVPYWQFDYDAWVMEDPLHNGKNLGKVRFPIASLGAALFGYDDILQYNYTDDPAGMKVVGLSATIRLDKTHLSPDVPPEYLLLYEATPDTFQLLAQVQWDETDTAGRPDAYMGVNPISCHNTSGQGGLYYVSYNNPSYVIKTFDYYFDKPIVVYDSFYVGGTDHSISGAFLPEPIPVSESFYITFRPTYVNFDSTCIFPALWKLYHYYSRTSFLPAHQWHWMPSNQFLMILPIIEVVDTSFANVPECPRVMGLFARGSFTDTVTVQWSRDSMHRVFEVSYGREGTAPDDGTIVTVYDTRWEFTDTAYRDIPMVSYVRTVCREYDTLRWGEWSSPLRWRLHHEADTGGHGEIGVPEERGDLSRFVQLMPNPASGSVVVNSSYGIERVEVYDLRGERVFDQPTDSRNATFDVSAWPKGSYVVLVHTSVGTATKRLLVQ